MSKLKWKFFVVVVVGNLYRPNSGPMANISRFNEILSDLILKIQSDSLIKQSEGIVLLGDTNINLLRHLDHQETANYLDILFDNHFLPLIVLPTRTHRSATVIVHISTNIKDTFFDTGIILKSDHFPVFYIRHTKNKKSVKKVKKTRLIREAAKKKKFIH